MSPVKWTINELYGLGRDEHQFIVYRAKRRTSDKPRAKRHAHKAVAYFTSLEAAMVWVIMRQAHFPDEPTIDTDLLDAFQSYCHHLDRVRADIRALAERLEMAGPAMRKPEIEAALHRHLRATSHALINVRDKGGSCLLCQALRGEQHLPTCPLWPLIDSRIKYRMAEEGASS